MFCLGIYYDFNIIKYNPKERIDGEQSMRKDRFIVVLKYQMPPSYCAILKQMNEHSFRNKICFKCKLNVKVTEKNYFTSHNILSLDNDSFFSK